MNVKKYLTSFLIAGILGATGCIEPYTPPLSKNAPDLLVVDGSLNSTDGEVVVSLTRTMALGDLTAPNTVKATVYLEDSDNQSTVLLFQGNGKYILTGLSVDESKSYRIRIITDSNDEYVSDLVPIKQTPEIDSVTWKQSGENIEIDVHTHDATGNSRYYLWTYDEVWEYRSFYPTSVKWMDGQVVSRTPEENITSCWSNDESSKILIGSSIRLTDDVIHEMPIQSIPKYDNRISAHYSILVKQSAISEETYNFYKDLRKTTEELGGLFDPQPGRVLGNIRSTTNPDEAVLGIFNAGTVMKKRLFFKHTDLPRSFQTGPLGDCGLDTVSTQAIGAFDAVHFNIVGFVYSGIQIVGYTFSTKYCTDCRLRGGTTNKPDFWP